MKQQKPNHETKMTSLKHQALLLILVYALTLILYKYIGWVYQFLLAADFVVIAWFDAHNTEPEWIYIICICSFQSALWVKPLSD